MFTRSGFMWGAVISLACASQASAAIFLQDNFDTYADQAAFEAVWEPAPSPVGLGILPSGIPSTAQSVTAPNSVHNPGTLDNAQAKRNQRLFAEPGLPDIASDNVIRFSFDYFDSNAAAGPFRHHTNLQDGINATASGQLVAMGLNNNQLASASGGNYYMGRILGYDPAETPATDPGAFFKLNEPGAPLRSTGWHNLAVEISEIDFRFFVDDILSEVVPNTFPLRSYDVVRLGSGLSNANNEAFYDNVLVETIQQVRGTNWNIDADGNWSSAIAWSGEVPNAVGAAAVLGAVITAPRTITLDSPVTVGRLTFQNQNAYTIAGPGPLTLFGSAGAASIKIASGSHTISAPVTLADNTLINVVPAAGSLSITGALDAIVGINLTKAGLGNLSVSRARVGALSVNDGMLAIVPNGGDSGTSVVQALNIGPTGRFDLTNNDLIIRAFSDTKNIVHGEVQAEIISAQNGLDENFITKWDGPGITSSTARSANVAASFDLTAIGVIRNSDLDITTGVPGSTYTTFGGQPVEPNDVLVKYTYTGDGNLDGAVTFDDYAAMDAAFFGTIQNLGWATGDINFDGVINFDDYAVVDQAFFSQGASLSGDAKLATVPEPGTMVLFAVGLFLLSIRRARR